MSFKLSLDTLKSALDIPASNTTKDALLNLVIDGTHAAILTRICGGLSADVPTSYTDVFDVTRVGYYDLSLRRMFVTGITSVETSGDLGSTYTTLDASMYAFTDLGRVTRRGGYDWPIGVRSVRVVYTAGIPVGGVDEAALAQAELYACIDRWHSLRRIGLQEESIGDYSYTRDRNRGGSSVDFPPEVEATLAQYTIAEAWRGTVP